MNKIKVLMVGPARNVKGGMTTVIDHYISNNNSNKISIDYFETINDKNIFSKFLKEVTSIIKYKNKVQKYDVVHIHMASRRSTFRKLLYVRMSKSKHKKVIIHVHGGDFKNFFEKECSFFKKKYIKKYLNMADHIIVLSDEWKNYFSNIVSKEKISVIYNGVILPSKIEKIYDNHNILFMGRICHEKGVFDLIEVFKKIHNVYEDSVLNICGNDDKEELKKLIAKYDITESVNVLGWIKGEEKEKQLLNNSIFVLPSYIEAMPMSILEAMSYYNYVISTNVGNIASILDNGECGAIIQPGDKKALYNELNDIMDRKNINKKICIAKNARKKIEKEFNITTNIDKTNRIYESVFMK